MLVLVSGPRTARVVELPGLIGGPLAQLLASSTDLGPARTGHTRLTAVLHDPSRPEALIGWANSHALSVRWRSGQDWAFVEGAPGNVARAFGVAVHNYRSPGGQVFYASGQQPAVPAPVRGEVTALGRILNYHPVVPLDVPGGPDGGLSPTQLLTTYNAGPLAATGKGQTVVFFEGEPFTQANLDGYVDHYPDYFSPPSKYHVTPTYIDGKPSTTPEGEADMDIEVVHAIAPDARLVVVNMDDFGDDTTGEGFDWKAVGNTFQKVDQDPSLRGAVWSISYGIGCDTIDTAADTQPARSALAVAETHGTSAFTSSGDDAGYECKTERAGGPKGDPTRWGAKPLPDEIGLNTLASLPEMTDVGGTTLSTDANGMWLAEATWVSAANLGGTGGGLSHLFDRPDWQKTVTSAKDPDGAHRLTPDIAADADPASGVDVLTGSQVWGPGGGTSQAAPIWAGLTVLMNQYLLTHGAHALGAMNPLLYQVAAHGALPAFHDVTLAGNAVHNATPGFDMVTGLGTPNTDNLVHDLLDIQRAGG